MKSFRTFVFDGAADMGCVFWSNVLPDIASSLGYYYHLLIITKLYPWCVHFGAVNIMNDPN